MAFKVTSSNHDMAFTSAGGSPSMFGESALNPVWPYNIQNDISTENDYLNTGVEYKYSSDSTANEFRSFDYFGSRVMIANDGKIWSNMLFGYDTDSNNPSITYINDATDGSYIDKFYNQNSTLEQYYARSLYMIDGKIAAAPDWRQPFTYPGRVTNHHFSLDSTTPITNLTRTQIGLGMQGMSVEPFILGARYGRIFTRQSYYDDGYNGRNGDYMHYSMSSQTTAGLQLRYKDQQFTTSYDITGMSPNGTEYWQYWEQMTNVEVISHGRRIVFAYNSEWTTDTSRPSTEYPGFTNSEDLGMITIMDLDGSIIKYITGDEFKEWYVWSGGSGNPLFGDPSLGRGLCVHDGHIYTTIGYENVSAIGTNSCKIIKLDIDGNYVGQATWDITPQDRNAGTANVRDLIGVGGFILASDDTADCVKVFDLDLNFIGNLRASNSNAMTLRNFARWGKYVVLGDGYDDHAVTGDTYHGSVRGWKLNTNPIGAYDLAEAYLYGSKIANDDYDHR